jgi:hypothetical protein
VNENSLFRSSRNDSDSFIEKHLGGKKTTIHFLREK